MSRACQIKTLGKNPETCNDTTALQPNLQLCFAIKHGSRAINLRTESFWEDTGKFQGPELLRIKSFRKNTSHFKASKINVELNQLSLQQLRVHGNFLQNNIILATYFRNKPFNKS